MLPIYPFIAIIAGFGVYKLQQYFHSRSFISDSTKFHRFLNAPKLFRYYSTFSIFMISVILAFTLMWTLTFEHIYSKTTTRIAATIWMLRNIPAGSTLAVEHWDDRLPLMYGERFQFQELTLYDQPDNEMKWQVLNQKLAMSDYIILASNRLYVPLPKLADCSKYKLCYPETAKYYDKLFKGERGFTKVAEFADDPTIPLLNIPISDQAADESFTVYDHPKIIIFRKNK
jgi:hypothetical protein